MRIVVCVKQVIDPEIPEGELILDPATKRPKPEGLPLVMSTFDEIALEVALQLREALGIGTITVLTLGPASADEVLRKALAMQADEAVRIDPAGLGEVDSVVTAVMLAEAIRQTVAPVDIVVCGRQAADTDGGQVGLFVAEILGFPVVTNALRALPDPDGGLRVERETEQGVEVVEVRPPVLLTATNARTNVPRIPKVKDILAAQRKPIRVLGSMNLMSVDGEFLTPWVSVEDVFVPHRGRYCRMITGDSPETMAESLVAALLELKVL